MEKWGNKRKLHIAVLTQFSVLLSKKELAWRKVEILSLTSNDILTAVCDELQARLWKQYEKCCEEKRA
jgi:hypothetical protein